MLFWLHGRVINTYFSGRYRRKRDKLVERASAALIPTMWGPFAANCYRSLLDGIEHIAMVKVSNACVCIELYMWQYVWTFFIVRPNEYS